MDSVHWKGQKILVVSSRALIEADSVKTHRQATFERKMDVSPDVWERLPFWVRELLKMLKASGWRIDAE